MNIYCCGCQSDIEARLTSGVEIYPHRKDLHALPFWACDTCGNYVGCHHKTKDRTRPLGCIPTPELRKAKGHIHAILDPIWKSKQMKRKSIYNTLSNWLGYEYHTANIKSLEEGRKVYRLIQKLKKQIQENATLEQSQNAIKPRGIITQKPQPDPIDSTVNGRKQAK